MANEHGKKMRLSIGVTGHRDLLPEETENLRGGVRQFLNSLREEFPSLQMQFLSPLAEGADRLAAEVALDLGHPIAGHSAHAA